MKQDEELMKAAEEYGRSVVQEAIKELEVKFGGTFTAGKDCVPLVAKYFLAGAEWQRNHDKTHGTNNMT